MWVLRRFSQVTLRTSPRVRELVGRLLRPAPAVSRQLLDAEPAALMQLRHCTNDQLLALMRTYAGSATEELMSAASELALKRLHSLQADQQAACCFYLRQAGTLHHQFLVSVERAYLRDPQKFSPLAVAQLISALSDTPADAAFQKAADTFRGDNKAFSTEAGVLLLSAIARRGWKDATLNASIAEWAARAEGPQTLLLQAYRALLKLPASAAAVRLVEQKLRVGDMSLRSVEQLLSCWATYKRPAKTEAFARVAFLLTQPDVDVLALAQLLRALKLLPGHEAALAAAHSFIQSNLVLLTPTEVALLGCALLDTKDSDQTTRDLLSAALTSLKFSPPDILRLLLSGGADALLHPLLPQVRDLATAHSFSASELVLLVSLLARTATRDAALWSAVLREAEAAALQDAEQYMQLRSSLKSLQGVETAQTLAVLTQKYEESV